MYLKSIIQYNIEILLQIISLWFSQVDKIIKHFAFFGVELKHSFLNSIFDDEFVNMDFSFLADAVHPVDGLFSI